MNRLRALFLMGSIALISSCCLGTARTTHRSTRSFQLRFQLADFIVPANERWRLRWSSPYHLGDIRPAYDVRVIEGSARLGEHGEIQAQAFDSRPEKFGTLDLIASNGKAVVWLERGSRFGTANDIIQVEVSAYGDH